MCNTWFDHSYKMAICNTSSHLLYAHTVRTAIIGFSVSPPLLTTFFRCFCYCCSLVKFEQELNYCPLHMHARETDRAVAHSIWTDTALQHTITYLCRVHEHIQHAYIHEYMHDHHPYMRSGRSVCARTSSQHLNMLRDSAMKKENGTPRATRLH